MGNFLFIKKKIVFEIVLIITFYSNRQILQHKLLKLKLKLLILNKTLNTKITITYNL